MAAAAIPIAIEIASLFPVIEPLVKQVILGIRHMFNKTPAPANTGPQQSTVALQTTMTALDQLVKTGALANLPQSATVQAIIEAVYQGMRATNQIASVKDPLAPLAQPSVTAPVIDQSISTGIFSIPGKITFSLAP